MVGIGGWRRLLGEGGSDSGLFVCFFFLGGGGEGNWMVWGRSWTVWGGPGQDGYPLYLVYIPPQSVCYLNR